ncbi:MAG: GTP cyclohydrolase FolE2 [Candidatus Zipacnadales bacterium]
MKDVAAELDERGITIQRVGVRDIHLPVRIREKNGGHARVVGTFDTSVELAHYQRGTHMSRFVEILSRWSKRAIDEREIREILTEICNRFHARAASLMLTFKYFLSKPAPVTGIRCELDYDCWFAGRLEEGGYDFRLGTTVPITTLCPCSKEIAEFGAHSQRAYLRVSIVQQEGEIVWIEDLVPLLEAQGSSALFPILKRADERHVTEYAYHHPKFVEDVVRDTVLALQNLRGVATFTVECESFESIHNHNAYAYTEGSADCL